MKQTHAETMIPNKDPIANLVNTSRCWIVRSENNSNPKKHPATTNASAERNKNMM